MEIKQVLVVRKDLKMRKGKIAAQAAHASMKVFFDAAHLKKSGIIESSSLIIPMWPEAISWYEGAFAKICLYVESEEELDEVYAKAKEAGIPCSMIVDSGRTEFKGIPTKTVVAIGPYISEEINKITGDLKLL